MLRSHFPAINGLLRVLAWSAASLLALTLLAITVLPRSGRYTTLTVLSGSMAPAIPQGALVIVVPAAPSSVKVGDVITYTSAQPPYATLTHRVTAVLQTPDGLTFQTKGDANAALDSWQVRYAGMAGKVVLSLPYLGYVAAAAQSTAAAIGLAAALSLMLGGFWLRAVWQAPQLPDLAPLPPAPSGSTVSWTRAGAVAMSIAMALLLGRSLRVNG